MDDTRDSDGLEPTVDAGDEGRGAAPGDAPLPQVEGYEVTGRLGIGGMGVV